MDKNWLIRTKSNHILGPISKEKVRDLFNNGSIKPDDEVCTGNGFWFFIRETDMVDRFVLGDEIQNFNPISEAKDVLTSSETDSDIERPVEDITLIGTLNLSMLDETPEVDSNSSQDGLELNLAAPVLEEAQVTPTSKPDETASPVQKKKNKVGLKKVQEPKPPLKKQGYLKFFAVIGFILLFCLIYFRRTIIRTLFQGEVTGINFSIIEPLHAQEILPVKKKLF